FIYPEQAEVLAWVLDGIAPADDLKSIELQLMDWADDVAYGLMDIVDGAKARFITLDSLERWRGAHDLDEEELKWLTDLKTALFENKIERTFAALIGQCIGATSLRPLENAFSTRTHRQA